MSKFIVTYTILKEAYDDFDFMKELSEKAMIKAKGRELDGVNAGYELDDFAKNRITVHFIFK